MAEEERVTSLVCAVADYALGARAQAGQGGAPGEGADDGGARPQLMRALAQALAYGGAEARGLAAALGLSEAGALDGADADTAHDVRLLLALPAEEGAA
mmetsp:Transcript_9369/g.27296  ORF Transcript_9369/g.27296 Transcript_9369/m.27296 type:complete len:99 (-) Transcript_9369:58-354(-)